MSSKLSQEDLLEQIHCGQLLLFADAHQLERPDIRWLRGQLKKAYATAAFPILVTPSWIQVAEDSWIIVVDHGPTHATSSPTSLLCETKSVTVNASDVTPPNFATGPGILPKFLTFETSVFKQKSSKVQQPRVPSDDDDDDIKSETQSSNLDDDHVANGPPEKSLNEKESGSKMSEPQDTTTDKHHEDGRDTENNVKRADAESDNIILDDSSYLCNLRQSRSNLDFCMPVPIPPEHTVQSQALAEDKHEVDNSQIAESYCNDAGSGNQNDASMEEASVIEDSETVQPTTATGEDHDTKVSTLVEDGDHVLEKMSYVEHQTMEDMQAVENQELTKGVAAAEDGETAGKTPAADEIQNVGDTELIGAHEDTLGEDHEHQTGGHLNDVQEKDWVAACLPHPYSRNMGNSGAASNDAAVTENEHPEIVEPTMNDDHPQEDTNNLRPDFDNECDDGLCTVCHHILNKTKSEVKAEIGPSLTNEGGDDSDDPAETKKEDDTFSESQKRDSDGSMTTPSPENNRPEDPKKVGFMSESVKYNESSELKEITGTEDTLPDDSDSPVNTTSKAPNKAEESNGKDKGTAPLTVETNEKGKKKKKSKKSKKSKKNGSNNTGLPEATPEASSDVSDTEFEVTTELGQSSKASSHAPAIQSKVVPKPEQPSTMPKNPERESFTNSYDAWKGYPEGGRPWNKDFQHLWEFENGKLLEASTTAKVDSKSPVASMATSVSHEPVKLDKGKGRMIETPEKTIDDPVIAKSEQKTVADKTSDKKKKGAAKSGSASATKTNGATTPNRSTSHRAMDGLFAAAAETQSGASKKSQRKAKQREKQLAKEEAARAAAEAEAGPSSA